MKICYPCNLPFFVSQRWGEDPKYYKQLNMKGHNGWDFAVPIGTPIYATHDAIVWLAGIAPDESLQVSIDSLDGKIRTIYGHLSEIKVKNGDKVSKGQLIGLSGNSGKWTTGPHLHFGLHEIENMASKNPNNGWNGASNPAPYFDGTYPSNYTKKQLPVHAERFADAIAKCGGLNNAKELISSFENFQIAEKIPPYPRLGPKTNTSISKYGIM